MSTAWSGFLGKSLVRGYLQLFQVGHWIGLGRGGRRFRRGRGSEGGRRCRRGGDWDRVCLEWVGDARLRGTN